MCQTRFKVVTVLLVILALSAGPALAGNGKISGGVKSTDGAAIVGANVIIEGTTLGGSADVNGTYFILNVPPGTYRLRASAVGFTPKVVANVRVASDQTVTIDISLQGEAVGMQEVVVTAEIPLVDRTRIATKTTYSRDEVSGLPVATVFDVINTSASTYNGYVRGGRYVETKTLVDGIDVTDPVAAIDADARGIENVQVTYSGVVRQYDRNNVQTGLSLASIEEASLNTGAVGAEYTSATAGLVNITLKEGRGPLAGLVRFNMTPGGIKHAGPAVYLDRNAYFAERDSRTNPTDKAKYTWTEALAKDTYGYDLEGQSSTKPTMDGELSLSGSPLEDLGIFFGGRYFKTAGWYPGESYAELNASLKLTYQASSMIKINALGLLRDRGKLFGWKNSSFNDLYRYLLEGVPQNDGASFTGSLKMTHMLSNTTFYEVQASLVSNQGRIGYVDGNNDGIITFRESGDFLTFADTLQKAKYIDKFFSSGPKNGPSLTLFGSPPYQLTGPGIYYEDSRISTWTLRGDITSQITDNHQLKAGAQVRVHDIRTIKRSSPVGFIEENYDVSPREYGLYVQDRMEYAGLILNVGLRADALAYNEGDFANYFKPAATDPNPPLGIARAVSVRGATLPVKWYFTPKIGVSHPIGQEAAVYFSFSRQMTPQPYGNVFAAYNIYGTSPILPGASRVDQDPFISTNYELGAQWVFYQDLSLDVNAYFRNIENYGLDNATVVWRATPPAAGLYNVQFSGGYADARGVEFTVTKRASELFGFLQLSGRASYAYSYVKATSGPLGTTINPSDQTQFQTSSGDSAKYAGTLPFSDYRMYNRIQQNVVGVNSVLTGGYDRTHRIMAYLFFRMEPDVRLTLLGKWASGFFYNLQYGDPRSREQGRSPWTKQVDLHLEKGFELAGTRLAVFVDVKNLFDADNVLTYFQSPDGKGQEIWEKQGLPYGPDKRSTTLDGSPIYDIARQVYVGAILEF